MLCSCAQGTSAAPRIVGLKYAERCAAHHLCAGQLLTKCSRCLSQAASWGWLTPTLHLLAGRSAPSVGAAASTASAGPAAVPTKGKGLTSSILAGRPKQHALAAAATRLCRVLLQVFVLTDNNGVRAHLDWLSISILPSAVYAGSGVMSMEAWRDLCWGQGAMISDKFVLFIL